MIVKAVREDENMTQIVWTFLEVRQPPLYPNIRSSVLLNVLDVMARTSPRLV